MIRPIIYPFGFILFLLLSSSSWLRAQTKTKNKKKAIEPTTGFIDFNGYYDTRDFSVLTINILANLSKRFQYFSLSNYDGKRRGASSDLSSLYAEHNLRWGIHKKMPFDLTYQFVMRGGEKNDNHRLGIRWRLSNTPKLKTFFRRLNMSYSINPMFIDFREKTKTKYMTIIEHVYNIKILPKKLNNRIYLGGFMDQNFVNNDNGNISFKWVSEHQLGIRLVNKVFAVFEYRINTFWPDSNYGLGYGLEYKIKF